MIHKASRRLGAPSLVVLTAIALPGAVPMLAAPAVQADTQGRAGVKRHYKGKHRPGQAVRHGKRKKRPPAAELSLGTGGPGAPVLPGRTYSWQFSVTNAGRAVSGPAVFSAPLPGGVEFVSAEQNCSLRGGMAVCELGKMRPGETKLGMVTAKISAAAKPRQAMTSTAALSWGRSRVTKAFPPVTVADTADIAVDKSGPAAVRPGELIGFPVEVTNHGPSEARSVVLKDFVQSKAPVQVVGGGQGCARSGSSSSSGGGNGGNGGGSGGGMVCDIGTLAPGDTKKVTLRVRIGPNAAQGALITSPASATTSTTELNLANNRASVRTRVRVPAQRAVTRHKTRRPGNEAPGAAGGVPGTHGGVPGAPGGAPGTPGETRGAPAGAPAGPSRGMAELPRTGTEAALMADAGIGLMGIGLILYGVGRRRRSTGDA